LALTKSTGLRGLSKKRTCERRTQKILKRRFAGICTYGGNNGPIGSLRFLDTVSQRSTI
jgi:hypothetical protein